VSIHFTQPSQPMGGALKVVPRMALVWLCDLSLQE